MCKVTLDLLESEGFTDMPLGGRPTVFFDGVANSTRATASASGRFSFEPLASLLSAPPFAPDLAPLPLISMKVQGPSQESPDQGAGPRALTPSESTKAPP